MAEKPVRAHLKMKIPAGRATAAPPVGSTLGQYGVNMMDFINPFNDQTKDMQGATVTAHITVYTDKTMKFRVVARQLMIAFGRHLASKKVLENQIPKKLVKN